MLAWNQEREKQVQSLPFVLLVGRSFFCTSSLLAFLPTSPEEAAASLGLSLGPLLLASPSQAPQCLSHPLYESGSLWQAEAFISISSFLFITLSSLTFQMDTDTPHPPQPSPTLLALCSHSLGSPGPHIWALHHIRHLLFFSSGLQDSPMSHNLPVLGF